MTEQFEITEQGRKRIGDFAKRSRQALRDSAWLSGYLHGLKKKLVLSEKHDKGRQ